MLKKTIAQCFSLCTLYSSFALASEINLPRSGQTKCYDASPYGYVIPCAGTGQDGELQSGLPSPSPRFNDNGNGTVTDNLTGLIWLKNANCLETVGGVIKSSGAIIWTNALTWSKNLASGKCGLTDGSIVGQWRLPTRNELLTLRDTSNFNPVLPTGHPFTNVQSSDYWSSTTYAWFTDAAWCFNMGYGLMQGNYSGEMYKTSSYYVWPVR